MRQLIEYAVENYRGKNSFGFQLTKDLRERQIEQAIERYARGVKPEEVVALMDTSVLRSGKTGFLFTDRYLYSDKYKEEGPIGLMFLKAASVKPENNSCCVLTYEDGTTRDVNISVFLDVVDVLNMIIKQQEEQAQESDDDSSPEEKSVQEEENIREENLSEESDTPKERDEEKRTEEDAPQYKEDVTATELPIEIVPIDEFEESEEPGESREQRWLAELTAPEESGELLTEKGAESTKQEKEACEDTQEDEEGTAEDKPEEEKLEEPWEQILNKAENGDRAAMYQAAQLYYSGQQIPQDLKQSMSWFRESARLEYVPAMLRMMRFYREGEMVKKNLTLSLSWAKKAAATGEPQGRYALVDSYLYGLDGKQDTGAGLALLSKMAEQGDESAKQTVDDVLEKIKEAKEQFDSGIKNPSTASGYYEMGMYCLKGDGYYNYPKEAVQYFQKAAEKEHVHAQYQLALAYHTGEGIKKDEDACIMWLEKASAKSHKEAGELLRELQEKRRIKKEKTEFRNHLRQAEKGDAYAQSRVAELYLEGIGVKQDIGKGLEWYEKASETDEGYAARQLARIYTEGKYVPEDKEKAAYWRMVGGILDEL